MELVKGFDQSTAVFWFSSVSDNAKMDSLLKISSATCPNMPESLFYPDDSLKRKIFDKIPPASFNLIEIFFYGCNHVRQT
jgi:hypothetical protein